MTTFTSSIDYAALGDRLRAYRLGASLQAEDVAEKLGVSRAVVYRMEKARSSRSKRWSAWPSCWARPWPR